MQIFLEILLSLVSMLEIISKLIDKTIIFLLRLCHYPFLYREHLIDSKLFHQSM